MTPRAPNACALTAAKSAGGLATCRRIAAQSPFCQPARKVFSVACGVEDEPPQADNPRATAVASTAAVIRNITRTRTPARIGGTLLARCERPGDEPRGARDQLFVGHRIGAWS